MKINDVIRTRRQALGLTQEILAGKLGVSAPAVNKWERGLNYPDITLLPVLARTLGVDLNTLLSFQEDMSEEEIGAFLTELSETARSQGGEAAFQLARDKLLEFPNNDLLAYSVAGMLEGIRVLCPAESEERRSAWEAEVSALYERSVHSADPKVQELAAFTLASRSIGKGELDRAEELLALLPDTYREKGFLTATLRDRQGRREEAWVLLEQELFSRANMIQNLLLHMIDLALKEGDRVRAARFEQVAQETGTALDLSDYALLSLPLQLALAEQDIPLTLGVLDKLLSGLTRPWAMKDSSLYSHLPMKKETGAAQEMLLKCMLDQLEVDPELAFLREVPEYQALVERYRNSQPTTRHPRSKETSTSVP